MAENLKTETAWKRRLPWIAAIVLGTLSILAVNKYLTLQQGKRTEESVSSCGVCGYQAGSGVDPQ